MKNFLIFYLIVASFSQGFMCTVWRNSFLLLTNSTSDNVTVDVFTHERNGWIGLAFGNSTTNKNLFMLHYSKSLYFYDRNFDSKSRIDLKGEIDESIGYKIDNIMHLSFKVPYSFLLKNNYVFFARNSMEKPMNDSLIPLHEFYTYKMLDFHNYTDQFNIGWCSPVYLALPGRLFSFHLGITIPWISFMILVLLLCIYFAKDQPLKSRGSGPVLMAFTSIIPVLAEYILASGLDYETQYYYECFVTSFVIFTPFQVGGIIIIVHYFRYIIILNMQSQKKKSIENGLFGKDWKFKFLKRITHPFIIFILPVLWLVLYSSIVVVIYAFSDFKCGTNAQAIIRYFALGTGFVILGTILILYVWDCIRNFRLLIKCELKKFFFTNDHYNYRLEFSACFIIVIFMLIWLFIPMPTMIKITFSELIHFGSVWFSCLFVLLMTIYKKFMERFFYQTSEGSSELADIFLHDTLYQQFLEFSKNEWSMENVYFKKYCIDYRKANVEERKKLIPKMVILFLSFEDSTFEINVKKASILAVLKKIESKDYSEELFADLELENQTLVYNIFDRFRLSYEYQFYLSKMSMIKQM